MPDREQPTITDPEDVLALFRIASDEGFWGSITFSFQAGVLKMIRKESTARVNVDFKIR